ncbi:MAG: helix-turn-helix transcriptional regulator [Oscillospiraceae bacterium]|nr:helix-turn-helix transcriptional regulator [Oscillospiraceae bacterium]
MTFGKKISELRKSAGLSQEQFGEMFGVSRQSVSKWESDQTMPELTTIIRIADFFSISVDELLGRENMKTQQTEKVFKKSVKSNRQFKLGCILIVIGLVLTCVLMYIQRDMITWYGDPIRMLANGGLTDWLTYLLVLWPIFSGFGICWTAIYSKE